MVDLSIYSVRLFYSFSRASTYFNDTISPVLISEEAAALTLLGVSRLRRPS